MQHQELTGLYEDQITKTRENGEYVNRYTKGIPYGICAKNFQQWSQYSPS